MKKRYCSAFKSLLVLSLIALTLWGCSSVTGGAVTPTVIPPTSSAVTPTTSTPWSGGWNSFMLAWQGSQKNMGVLNIDYRSGKSENLTQYIITNAQFYGISHDGKDIIYK